MTIEITDPREFRKLPFDTVYHLMRWYSPETKLTFLEELKREVKFKELGINYKESKYFPINRLVLFREQYVTNEKFRNYFLGEISKDNDLNISLQIQFKLMVRDYPTIMQMGRPIDILKRQAQEIYNLLRDKQVALFDYIEYVYQRYKQQCNRKNKTSIQV